MKKRLLFTIIFIVTLLLIPLKIERLKDGGSTIYTGLIYNIKKIHMLSEQSSTGYIDGIEIKVFGLTIYSKLDNHIIKNKSDYEFSDKITLSLKKDTLPPKKATFVITNNSDEIYIYNTEYKIEVNYNNKWLPLKETNASIVKNNLYILKGYESNEIIIDWEEKYGKLTKGRYRLLKEVFKKIDESQINYICEEFFIDK